MPAKKEYLVFHLYGAMASFGDVAVGEFRPTHAHPTKSAILGLVAGALGIRRDQEEEHQRLETGLSFAVMVLSTGEFLRDYHTAQVPSSGKKSFSTRRDELSTHKSNLNTILSTRDYRTDAFYRVALWKKSQEKYSLKEIQLALIEPVFVPYLGRKSCPLAMPMSPEIVKAENELVALEQSDFLWKNKIEKVFTNIGKNGSVIYTESNEHESQAIQTVWRKDRLVSRKRWQFSDRKETMLSVKPTGDENVL
jgi:CRISPR system Cascade subunit CasD